jgi:hypothetical protein
MSLSYPDLQLLFFQATVFLPAPFQAYAITKTASILRRSGAWLLARLQNLIGRRL